MKFLISESEKQEILRLYGVISEQQSIAYEASTDKIQPGSQNTSTKTVQSREVGN
jgi:hypothetical protein